MVGVEEYKFHKFLHLFSPYQRIKNELDFLSILDVQ